MKPYVSQGSSWRCNPTDLAPGSLFQLASADLPARAVKLVKERRLHQKFGDFDDHLEDVTIGMCARLVSTAVVDPTGT